MARKYSKEERQEALKLAEEIGAAAAARRLGIKRIHSTAGEAGRKSGKPSWSRRLATEARQICLRRMQSSEPSCCRHSRMWRFFRRRCFFRQAPETVAKREKYRFIQAHIGRWPVAAMCRVLRVSQQGYYCFLRRPDKRERDQQLLEQIYACLREEPENANYGVRRIIWWLRLHPWRPAHLPDLPGA